MKIILSGGQFGGSFVNWPANEKVASLLHEGSYWNYDIQIHNDNHARADFCGCSEEPQGIVVEVIAE